MKFNIGWLYTGILGLLIITNVIGTMYNELKPVVMRKLLARLKRKMIVRQ